MVYSDERRNSFTGYIEDASAGNPYRAEYLRGIEKILEEKSQKPIKKGTNLISFW